MKKYILILTLFCSILSSKGAVTVSPTNLAGVNDTAYCQYPYYKVFTASGSTAPYHFTVTVGSLPQGMQLDTTTGQLSGIAGYTTSQSITFTIKARSTITGQSGTRAYTIYVRNKTLTNADLTNLWSIKVPQRSDVYSTWYNLRPPGLVAAYWQLNGNSFGEAKSIGTIDSLYFPIITKNTERARFKATGEFGIGTTTPTTFVQIVKNQNENTVLNISNSTAGTTSLVGSSYTSDDLTLFNGSYSTTHSNTYLRGNGVITGTKRKLILGSDISNGGSGEINFAIGGTAVANQKATILSTGSFGVANATPTSVLHVSHPGAYAQTTTFQVDNVITANFKCDYDGTVTTNGLAFIKDGTATLTGGSTFEVKSDNPTYTARFGSTANADIFRIKFNGDMHIGYLRNYANNAAALSGGLSAGDLYYTDTAGEYIVKWVH